MLRLWLLRTHRVTQPLRSEILHEWAGPCMAALERCSWRQEPAHISEIDYRNLRH